MLRLDTYSGLCDRATLAASAESRRQPEPRPKNRSLETLARPRQEAKQPTSRNLVAKAVGYDWRHCYLDI